MRILHISDLHASAHEDFGQGRLVTAFLTDVAKQHAEHPIDLIVFSGDLAHSGTPEDLLLGHSLLIDPLLDALALSAHALVMVPGNHDVHWPGINQFEDVGLAQILTNEAAVTRLLQDQESQASLHARLTNWYDYHEIVYDECDVAIEGRLARVHKVDRGEDTVGIAALNSAWRSHEGRDERRLLISEYQIVEALKGIKECDLQLIVSHHPLNWVVAFDEAACQRELDGGNYVYLSGHEHHPAASLEIRRRAGTVYSRAGCLYEHATYPNSYSLVDVEIPSHATTVSVRSWWVDRGEFDAATHIAEDGRFDFPAVGLLLTVAHPPFNVVRTGLADLAPQISPVAIREGLTEQVFLDDRVVPPRLLPLPYRDALAAKQVEDDLRADAVEPWNPEWDDAEVVLLGGDSESGLTTGVLWLLDQRYKRDPGLLPVFVPYEQRFSTRGIDAAINRGARMVGWDAQRGDVPALLIGVDDVAPVGRGLAILAAYIKAHPQHKWVLACREQEHDAVLATLSREELTCTSVFLAPFGRKEIRALVRNIAGPGSQLLVDRIVGIVRAQDLPRTPFILAALVAVMVSVNPEDLQSGNASSLLESYVSLLLGRDDIADREQLAMDYRRREYLLGSFAQYLVRRGVTSVSRLDAEEYLLGWFKSKGWGPRLSPGQVLDSLIARSILIQHDEGTVGFRQPALASLFTAKWMLEDPEFRIEILRRPLMHVDAISHAAALVRSSDELLEASTQTLSEILQEGEFTDVAATFESLKGEEGWARVFASAEEALEDEGPEPEPVDPQTEEERLDALIDEQLDVELPSDPTLDSAVARLAEAVSLQTWVLRSSELVDNIDLKSRALREAIRGWSVLGALGSDAGAVVAVRDFVSEHEEEIDDAELTDIERVVRLLLVISMLLGVQGQLGTVHLAGITDSLLKDTDFMNESGQEMFMTLLAFNLHQGRSLPHLRRLFERHHDHPIISMVVRAWAMHAYVLEEDRGLRSQLEELLVDMFTAESRSGGGREYGARRESVAAQLRAARLRQLGRLRAQVGGLDELDPGEQHDGL
ncbi:MAG TPA: metallophosphoesterase [Thermoleophilaceae bacterium]|jgi:predicted MPP superfamily phosphohydrolase